MASSPLSFLLLVPSLVSSPPFWAQRHYVSATDGVSSVVQGGALRTWPYESPHVEAVFVELDTNGRPMDAEIELWHGPNSVPCRLKVASEDGHRLPFRAILPVPRGEHTVAVRNVAAVELPLVARVTETRAAYAYGTSSADATRLTVQGGACRSYPFRPRVDCVDVLLETSGRPLHARIELVQGPDTARHVVEVESDDGLEWPVCCRVSTPDPTGCVVRVVNEGPIEFPLHATVGPGL